MVLLLFPLASFFVRAMACVCDDWFVVGCFVFCVLCVCCVLLLLFLWVRDLEEQCEKCMKSMDEVVCVGDGLAT